MYAKIEIRYEVLSSMIVSLDYALSERSPVIAEKLLVALKDIRTSLERESDRFGYNSYEGQWIRERIEYISNSIERGQKWLEEKRA